MYQVPLGVYEELEEATPEGKRDIVLRLIKEHPDHRLELPERDGVRADLSEVDLSREALQEIVDARPGTTPPWWNAEYQGARLRNADLQGAYMAHANLQGAILEHASLQGVFLWRANLQDASLAFANLHGAELTSAKVQCAILSGANLQGATLWEANLQGAHLSGAKLQGADLWDANLQGAELLGANLEGAHLTTACLQGAHLRDANLQGARLIGADLRGADLRSADLQGADLWKAQLQGADLLGSRMHRCYLSEAWLDRTRLRREQLGGAVGEELDGDYRGAKLAYLGLKQNFSELGDYAAASWAYRKERRMEKREALQKAHDAHARRDWKRTLSSYGKVFFDQMVELVCDYGEGFWRVLGCLALLWLGFALFYGITGHVRSDSGLNHITRNVWDLLSFSLASMVTLEAPGLYAYPTRAMRILMPLEAALGIFFLGLLGFVAGNRIRRS